MKMKKLLVAVASAALSMMMVCGCGQEPDFKTNKVSKEDGKAVANGLAVYSSDEAGFSFLYPENDNVEFDEDNGVTIYIEDEDEIPYMLVKRTNKEGMTPQKYFKDSNKQILKTLKNVASTNICETKIDGKTTYMTRYIGELGDDEIVIERYIEIYEDFYIEYSAFTDEVGSLNTELYYAIKTLSTNTDAYLAGDFSDKLKSYKSDLGIKISLPVMFETKELTVGYLSTNDDAVILCVVCDEDNIGNKIDGRDDFLKAAAKDSGFVASFIGAESATFGSGSKEEIGGVGFYSYPAQIVSGGENMSGKMLLADYDDGGCVVVLYAVNETAENAEDIKDVCESAIETLRI